MFSIDERSVHCKKGSMEALMLYATDTDAFDANVRFNSRAVVNEASSRASNSHKVAINPVAQCAPEHYRSMKSDKLY